MARNRFDLSGGKRSSLHDLSRPAARQARSSRSAGRELLIAASFLAIALAFGIGFAILADGQPRYRAPDWLGEHPADKARAEAEARKARDARRAADEAVQSAQESLREAREISAEAERISNQSLIEAEQAIRSARERAAEQVPQD